MSVDLARLLSQLTVIAGVVILLMPQTLNYIVAAYLIITAMGLERAGAERASRARCCIHPVPQRCSVTLPAWSTATRTCRPFFIAIPSHQKLRSWRRPETCP